MFDETRINQEMNQLLAEKRFDEIIERSDEVVEEYPSSYLGRWWKARAYMLKGDSEKAFHWFIEAMKNAEDEFEESKISTGIANLYISRKKWRKALNYTEIALELNPENPEAVLARSIALAATGQRKTAYRLLDQYGRLFREDYQKAGVAAVKRDKQKLLEHLSKALRKDPGLRANVLFDPVFSVYRRDPDFKALLKD